MNPGSLQQFVSLKFGWKRPFRPHSTATNCYCHRCLVDFMVHDIQRERDRLDRVEMRYLDDLDP